MSKQKKTFDVDSLVFAKVKGFPAWPAKVTGVLGNNRYSLYFFGTAEVANLKVDQLVSYVDGRPNVKEQSLKKPEFRDGIDQIEEIFKATGGKLAASPAKSDGKPKTGGAEMASSSPPTKKAKVAKQEKPAVAAAAAAEKAPPAETEDDTEDDSNFVIATVPIPVRIKVDYNKPESFADKNEEKKWQKQASKEAMMLKKKLENREVKLQEVADRIVFDFKDA